MLRDIRLFGHFCERSQHHIPFTLSHAIFRAQPEERELYGRSLTTDITLALHAGLRRSISPSLSAVTLTPESRPPLVAFSSSSAVSSCSLVELGEAGMMWT